MRTWAHTLSRLLPVANSQPTCINVSGGGENTGLLNALPWSNRATAAGVTIFCRPFNAQPTSFHPLGGMGLNTGVHRTRDPDRLSLPKNYHDQRIRIYVVATQRWGRIDTTAPSRQTDLVRTGAAISAQGWRGSPPAPVLTSFYQINQIRAAAFVVRRNTPGPGSPTRSLGAGNNIRFPSRIFFRGYPKQSRRWRRSSCLVILQRRDYYRTFGTGWCAPPIRSA